ncbi:protein LEAD-SENSITIVE 1-like [Magnolia sinica]|uniref:protein LEAD-SENSITIVE 1-like n=1 Tax=Magnolia sinica TaxID=86752 RepID=UPI002659CA25|nr:protein LEAD-SENSITIVE 1-like [Magnolia sinica]
MAQLMGTPGSEAEGGYAKMIAVLSSLLSMSNSKPGDHIYAWRNIQIYAHHGIYMGDNKVIHFNAATGQKIESGGCYRHCDKCGAGKNKTTNGLILSCLDCFLDGDQLYIYEYSVSWIPFVFGVGGKTCSMAKSDPLEVVLRRANECLNNGFRQYNFILNNCESFAFYCKTGRAEAPCCSGQTINLISNIANGATQSFIPGTVIGLVGEVMTIA